MTNKQAIREAIKCMEEVAHKYAIDANLYIFYNCDTPEAKSAYERREKIKEAITILSSLFNPHAFPREFPSIISPDKREKG